LRKTYLVLQRDFEYLTKEQPILLVCISWFFQNKISFSYQSWEK